MSLFAAVRSVSAPLTPGAVPNRPGWKARLAAISFYFGLLPLLRPFRFLRGDAFVQHHAAQALAIILAFLAVLGGCILYWMTLSYLLVYRRDLYEGLPPLGSWDAPVRDVLLFAPVVLIWLLCWLGGLCLALSGSRRTLPLIGRLAHRPLLLRLAFAGNVSLLAAAVLIAVLALHASSLTRDDDEPAAAYLLYDDMGGAVPRWAMNLGFYRISLAAQTHWGPGSTIVAPLDEYHLQFALRHGRFVFLACHGHSGEIVTQKIRIFPGSPAETRDVGVRGLWVIKTDGDPRSGGWRLCEAGEKLQFVYNTACDSGMKAAEWEQALTPARVRTFGRLSAVAEHMLWLWSDAPRFIREME